MKKVYFILIITCVIFAFDISHADLQEIDDAVFGVNAITWDTATGLEWLDVTFSVNRSYLDVSSQFGTGGDYEGFRHATVSDLEAFFFAGGIPYLGQTPNTNLIPYMTLSNLVGVTSYQDGYPQTQGIAGDEATRGGQHTGTIDYVFFLQYPTYKAHTDLVYGQTTKITTTGHWLLRDVAIVPEPVSSTLFIVGATTLGFSRFRKKFKN